MKYKLSESTHICLCEALRRYCRFGEKKKLTEAWTGLGTNSEYKSAKENGYMKMVYEYHGPYDYWWVLTPKGAKIVKYWMSLGYNENRIENNDLPPIEM